MENSQVTFWMDQAWAELKLLTPTLRSLRYKGLAEDLPEDLRKEIVRIIRLMAAVLLVELQKRERELTDGTGT